MGYNTQFNVTIHPENKIIRAIIAEDDTFYALGSDGESYKWYGHEDDMRKLSQTYPEHVFELSGEGENAGDMWRKYFKNGKMQSCPAIVTYDPFDESKLN